MTSKYPGATIRAEVRCRATQPPRSARQAALLLEVGEVAVAATACGVFRAG